MKHVKKFNENFLGRLEGALKGKSGKGKIVEDMLKKNNISTEGFAYCFRYTGGADLTHESNSHPISFLVHKEDNKGKLKNENGKFILTDDALKSKKVVNIIPMIDKEEKEGVKEHGRIWSSAVIKFSYKFDLSLENPTFTMSNPLIFDINTGQWVKNEQVDHMSRVETLDGEIDKDEKNLTELFDGVIFNKELVTTYQAFIDEVNKRKDIIDIISKHEPTLQKEPVQEGLIVKKFNKFK